MKTYAAKLLFQFRVVIDGDSGKRRTCEERIILVKARTAKAALARAKRDAAACRNRYKNSDGNTVFFKFVGVMDLLHLGSECSDGEVWYDIKERMLPMERRDRIIPAESELNAIVNESE